MSRCKNIPWFEPALEKHAEELIAFCLQLDF
jgi:hypothetical protein